MQSQVTIAVLFRRRHDVIGAMRWMLHTYEFALAVRRERRALASLDDHMLRDIGLSRSMVHRETSRSLFDLPQNRAPWLPR